jgi:signal transduction histidine kinase
VGGIVAVRVFSRLPVRLRVALAFSAAMAVLLAATGLFLYLQLDRALDLAVDRGLRDRAGDVRALVAQSGAGPDAAGRSPLTERGEGLAQILAPDGTVVDARPPLRARPLLSRAELARAARGTILVSHADARSPRPGDGIRLLGTPVGGGERLVVVVGAPLAPNEEAQHELGGLLLLGGPIALLLASLAGYGAAAGALRPVELMRRRAREIQAGRPGRRLPVPPTGDEVARLGETLNDMLARLEAAFDRERAFVADASHELRTPLAILKAELELARRDARTVEALRAALESASEEADRLERLAEDLLVIARADQGRLPVRAGPVRAAALLEAVRRRFAARASAAGVALCVADTDPHLVLVADEARLEQALGNLVDNALRHGGRVVELSARAVGERAEVHVRDDGPGFPERFLPTAFERFTRADVARARGGAGLGLAIVAAIAAAHGGRAAACNAPGGGGADVWLELPQEQPAVVAAG